jgi:hypothetical protein
LRDADQGHNGRPEHGGSPGESILHFENPAPARGRASAARSGSSDVPRRVRGERNCHYVIAKPGDNTPKHPDRRRQRSGPLYNADEIIRNAAG